MKKIFALSTLSLLLSSSLAAKSFAATQSSSNDLPQLVQASQSPAANISANGSAASLSMDSPVQRLLARLNYGNDTHASIGIDYARILGDQLAFGANLSLGSRYREVLLSGLYSPFEDTQLRVSLGQLRSKNTYQFFSGSDQAEVKQNNVLFGGKKRWDKPQGSMGVADFGFTAYAVRALEPHLSEKLMLTDNTANNTIDAAYDPRKLAVGKLRGVVLNLGLIPSHRTKIDLSLGAERVRYNFFDGSRSRTTSATGGIRLTQYFDQCLRMQIAAQHGVANNLFSLGLEKTPWSFSFERSIGRDGNPSDSRLMASYQIPLDPLSQNSSASCKPTQLNVAKLSILDALTTRPSRLPTTPLAKVDRTAKPALVAMLDKSVLQGQNINASRDQETIFLTLPDTITAIPLILLNGIPVTNSGNGGPLATFQGNTVSLFVKNLPNPGPGVTVNYMFNITYNPANGAVVDFDFAGH